MELVLFLDSNVNIFDMEFEVIDYFFTKFVEGAFFLVDVLHF